MSTKLRHFVESVRSILKNLPPSEPIRLTHSHHADIKTMMGQIHVQDLGINQDRLLNEMKRSDR